jgi:hypothetical protein
MSDGSSKTVACRMPTPRARTVFTVHAIVVADAVTIVLCEYARLLADHVHAAVGTFQVGRARRSQNCACEQRLCKSNTAQLTKLHTATVQAFFRVHACERRFVVIDRNGCDRQLTGVSGRKATVNTRRETRMQAASATLPSFVG